MKANSNQSLTDYWARLPVCEQICCEMYHKSLRLTWARYGMMLFDCPVCHYSVHFIPEDGVEAMSNKTIVTRYWGKSNNPLYESADVVLNTNDNDSLGQVIRSYWHNDLKSWVYLIDQRTRQTWVLESSLMLLDKTEQINRWVRRWCSCLDLDEADEALLGVARIAGCLGHNLPDQLNDDQSREIAVHIDTHYPGAYLQATRQLPR